MSSTGRRRVRSRARAAGGDDIASRIQRVDDISHYAKVLIFGQNKVGKTTFCSTAPSVLIVDINEEGTSSAKGSGARVIEVKEFAELDEVYWHLKGQAGKDYESVALDTMTALATMAMAETLDKRNKRRSASDRSQTPDKRDWGTVFQMMRPVILNFRNLPMHVIFTAQERRVTDEDTDELLEIVPSLSAGPRGALMDAVGVTGRIYKAKLKGRANRGKFERRLIVGDHDIVRSGNRLQGALPTIMRNPTMPDIIAAYQQ